MANEQAAIRRVHTDEQYLRSEHLMVNGRFAAVTLTIKGVLYDCRLKKMGAQRGDDATVRRMALEFVETERVLGLNRTNDNLVCHVTGNGSPQLWVGAKIQLVVRLIYDKIEKRDIPAIRVWPASPHPRKQVREQMGREVTQEWYDENTVKPASPAASREMSPEQKEFNAWADKMVAEGRVTREHVRGYLKEHAGNYTAARSAIEAILGSGQ